MVNKPEVGPTILKIGETRVSLVADWWEFLTKAWSVRAYALAAVCSCVQAILPYYAQALPERLFMFLTVIFIILGFAAQFWAQGNMKGRR